MDVWVGWCVGGCVGVWVCGCVGVCVCVWVGGWVHVRVCVRTCVWVCVRAGVYVRLCTYVCMYVCMACVYVSFPPVSLHFSFNPHIQMMPAFYLFLCMQLNECNANQHNIFQQGQVYAVVASFSLCSLPGDDSCRNRMTLLQLGPNASIRHHLAFPTQQRQYTRQAAHM